MNNVHGTMKGFVRWELLNPHGDTVQHGEHSNLLLNSGLDHFAAESNGNNTYYSGLDEQKPFGGFRSVLHVGTGTNMPDVSDLALTNRVTGSGTGGFNAEQGVSYSLTPGWLFQTSTQVRVVDITAAANLTEYGLGPNTNILSIRELFRNDGDAVVVSVQPGYQIKLTHYLTLGLPLAAVDGVLNLGDGDMMTRSTFYTSGSRATNELYGWLFDLFAPGKALGAVRPMTAADGGEPNTLPPTASMGGSSVLQPYVPGSYQRVKRYTVAPASGNLTHSGWVFCWNDGYPDAGYKVALQGASVIKTSSQRLTLDLAVSWGRA